MSRIPELKSEEIGRLIRAATDSRDQAYAPHSHFYVGAAIWMPNGEIIVGCNIENALCRTCRCGSRSRRRLSILAGDCDRQRGRRDAMRCLPPIPVRIQQRHDGHRGRCDRWQQANTQIVAAVA